MTNTLKLAIYFQFRCRDRLTNFSMSLFKGDNTSVAKCMGIQLISIVKIRKRERERERRDRGECVKSVQTARRGGFCSKLIAKNTEGLVRGGSLAETKL